MSPICQKKSLHALTVLFSSLTVFYFLDFGTLAQLEWKKMQRENKSLTKCVFQLALENSKLTCQDSLEKTESDIVILAEHKFQSTEVVSQ